jgi:hypothetical protein
VILQRFWEDQAQPSLIDDDYLMDIVYESGQYILTNKICAPLILVEAGWNLPSLQLWQ